MKLNGWQRLWVLLSAIYFIFVALYVVLMFPQAEAIPHQSKFYEKLSKKFVGIIWPTTHEDALALGIGILELYKQTIGSGLPDYVITALSWDDYQSALKYGQNNSGKLKELRSPWGEYLERIKKLPEWAKPLDDIYQTIEMPNKHEIKFLNKSSDEDIIAASQEYWQIVEQKTKETRLQLLFNAFLFWIIPCLLSYVSGLSIHWVYKGFKKKSDYSIKTREE